MYVYMYMDVYMCVCIYIYIYIHTHTHMLVGRRRTESSVRLPGGNQENCSAARLGSGRSNAREIRAVH